MRSRGLKRVKKRGNSGPFRTLPDGLFRVFSMPRKKRSDKISPLKKRVRKTLLPAWLKKKVRAVNPKRPRIKKNENR
jgi:hypothetical protein